MDLAVRRTRLSTAAVAIVALIAAVLVPIVDAPEAAHADPPAPSSITLAADASTFVAGDSVTLTATTDVTVTGTGQTIRIFDDTTSTELESCTSGLECVVEVQFFTGGAHTYYATVGALESDPVDVARAEWSVTLATDDDLLAIGETAEITATANQDLGETDDEYELFIFDQTSEELVTSCSTGTACVGDSPEFYLDRSAGYSFIAVVGAAGSPETIGDVTDVQATSDPVGVARDPIMFEFEADREELSAGDTVNLEVTADQDVGDTNGLYAIHIFEAVSGDLIKTCTSGTSCITDYTWNGAGWAATFVAFVDGAAAPEHISDVEDVQFSDYVSMNIDQWEVEISTDKLVLAAGETGTITAVTDQDLSGTSGALATYIIDYATDTIVATCTTGTSCVGTDHFYKESDYPFAAHVYSAWVAAAGATNPYDLGVIYANDSPYLRVASLPWTAKMDLTGGGGDHFQFTVQLNQSPGQTGGQLAFYLYNLQTFEYEGQCLVSKRCVITTQHASEWGYLGYVTQRVATHTDASEASNVWASAGVYWSALVDGQPVFGPVLDGEGIGGGNPSQKACQCAHADPINTATGEFFESLTDIGIPGAGPDLSLQRSYSTTSADVDGPFGFGWSAAFDAHIEVLIPGDLSNPLPIQLQVVQENGSTALFTRDESSDTYESLGRVQAELEFDATADEWVFVRGLTETLSFDSEGRMLTKSDVNGNVLVINRDSSGKVSTITASGGRELTLSWTGERLTSVADSAGRSVSYGYDSQGDLVSFTAVDGAITSYTYDSAHRVLTMTRPGGGVTTNVYDSEGRVASQTDPVGRETTFSYATAPSAADQTTTITYPDGAQVVENYVRGAMTSQTRAAGTPYEATTTNTYDAALNIISTTDPAGGVTTFTYNDDGRMLTRTDPLARISTWTYDALGNVTSAIDPLNRETTYDYDSDGNLLSVEHPGGGFEEWTYNADGTVATHEDARGGVTEYAYTAQGWVASVEDPVGGITITSYSDAGFAISATDPLSNTSEMTRDAAGRVLTSTDPLDRSTVMTYDADGNLLSATDPEGGVTSATFDLAGQRTSKTDATGNVTTYAYTLGGQLATTTQPGGITTTDTYNALGQVVSTTDALGRITYYEYDLAGRLSTTTRPSGAAMTDEYDLAGQLISRTDAAGEVTTYEYDVAGQLIASTDPLNRETSTTYTADGWIDTVTLPDSSEILYDYDAAGNVTQVTDADGYVTTNSYEQAGRVTETVRPGGITTEYSYDLAGRLTVKTLPDSTTLTHVYDAAGQLIEIDPSLTGAVSITYSYDDAGRRTGMVDTTGTTTAAYDAAGRLTTETDGNGNTVGYTYDALGRLAELTYPSTKSVTYAYNGAGEMVSLTDWNANTTSFTWTLDGELATRIDPNGVTVERAYSTRGELTGMVAETSTDDLLSIAYGYDDAGQLVSREFSGDAYPDSAAQYEYDLLGQLAATDYSGDYESSSGGQLLHLSNGSSLGYDSAQQLEELVPDSGPVIEYTYNDNGARISATAGASSTDYDYNAFGGLISVSDGASTVAYEVDGSGLRRTRTEGALTAEFAWATNGSIALLVDDGDHSFLYGPGISPVAQATRAGEIEYLYSDLVGSTVLIVSDDGSSSGYYEYAEYGNLAGSGGTLSTVMQYTGNWADSATGLLYLRARDYDPRVGQFIAVDPLVSETMQPYAYARNSPLQLSDPTGLCAILPLTQKDLLCHGYFFTGFGDSFSEQWAYFQDGFEHGTTFNISMLWDPEYDKNWGEASYWAGDVAGVLLNCAGLLSLGMGGVKTGDAPLAGEPALPGLPASAPPVAGLGSTGRTAPANLAEQLAMTQIRSNPGGTQLPLRLGDPRWPASEGWVKMSETVNGVTVHYVRNTRTGAVDDFKFIG